MAFGINAYNAECVRSYEDAARLFKKPANLRRMGWTPDMRPLDGVRKTHMYVQVGPDAAYYDVILYQTAMARYFKPVPSGTSYGDKREVWHNVHGSQSSSSFQWSVLGFGASNYTMTSTEGKRVLVGMNPNGSGPRRAFPVRLHLVGGKLDVANSTDSPAQLKSLTSADRKAERRAFSKWLTTYEAMSKIIDGQVGWMANAYTDTVKDAFMTNALFDPTHLCMYIKARGKKKVVDSLYPLGDVDQFNPSFKELT